MHEYFFPFSNLYILFFDKWMVQIFTISSKSVIYSLDQQLFYFQWQEDKHFHLEPVHFRGGGGGGGNVNSSSLSIGAVDLFPCADI